VTLKTALEQGAAILEKANIGVPRLTAEVLLGHAMRCDRVYLFAHATDELTENAWIHYGRYLNERLKGKPTQYITQRQEFYSRDFHVNSDVLIPRPDTEHLAEAGIAWLREHPGARALDVGTGSGAIAITLAAELDCAVSACDISVAALAVAERNRARHQARVAFFVGDLVDAVAARSIDLLISNPPYVPGADAANMQTEVRNWEPHVALFAGDTGLEIYQRLIAGAAVVLKPGGRLLMELGYQSLEGVRARLADGWHDFEVISDLAGWPRVIGATGA
jgi:release factor glutamine methyltransferase